jgi:hypothetical protein
MMGTNAGLHADPVRTYAREPHVDLAACPLLTQHDRAALIEADNVERIVTDIDALCGNDRI